VGQAQFRHRWPPLGALTRCTKRWPRMAPTVPVAVCAIDGRHLATLNLAMSRRGDSPCPLLGADCLWCSVRWAVQRLEVDMSRYCVTAGSYDRAKVLSERDTFRRWNEDMAHRYDPEAYHNHPNRIVRALERMRVHRLIRLLDVRSGQRVL